MQESVKELIEYCDEILSKQTIQKEADIKFGKLIYLHFNLSLF